MSKVHIVVAMAKNRVIGKDNKMLWKLPEDMEYFKKLTMNKIVVMGRKTFESIGRALPGRITVVISRQSDYRSKSACPTVDSLEKALDWGGDKYDVYIIGGAEIYQQAILKANTLYVTKIEHEYEGDVYFPEIDENVWKLVECRGGRRDRDLFPYDYWFMVYERNTK